MWWDMGILRLLFWCFWSRRLCICAVRGGNLSFILGIDRSFEGEMIYFHYLKQK